MSEPKRANEHAERLKMASGAMLLEGPPDDPLREIITDAAAEIERLAARVAELEAAAARRFVEVVDAPGPDPEPLF